MEVLDDSEGLSERDVASEMRFGQFLVEDDMGMEAEFFMPIA